MKGTGAKRNVCTGSCVSTGAKFPVAPVESAPVVRAQSFRTCIHSRAEFYVRAYNSGLVRVAWWRNGESVDLPLERSRVRISTVPLSGNNFGQVIHKRVSVTKQYHLVPVKGR